MSVVSQASTILVAVDHSSGSLTALARARSITTVTDDTLILCTVLEGDSGDEVVHQARQQLANLAPEAETQVRVGSPFIELIRAARETDARLIVAGTTGEHTKGLLALGVTVDRLARKADRPLLVVRKPPQDRYQTVIVGVDGSSDAARAAHLARRLAPEARITAIMATPPIGEHLLIMRGTAESDLAAYRNRLEENARELLAEAACDLPLDHQEVAVGRAQAVLLDAADRPETELVAVGRRGLSPMAAVLLGSVSHHMVHEAPCDVLVYRSGDLRFQPP